MGCLVRFFGGSDFYCELLCCVYLASCFNVMIVVATLVFGGFGFLVVSFIRVGVVLFDYGDCLFAFSGMGVVGFCAIVCLCLIVINLCDVWLVV